MDPPAQSIVYKNAVALILLPQCERNSVPEEISRLAQIVDKQYQYHLRIEMSHMARCPSRRNGPYQSKIDQRDDALWILYYRGPSDPESIMKTLGYMSGSDLRWGHKSIARNGEALRRYADLLCILDCPLPAEWEDIASELIAQRPAAQHTRTSLFEVLAAKPPSWTPQSRSSTSTSTSTPTKSDTAFLQALCWALETFADSRENCSVAELAAKIRDAPGFPRDQTPVHMTCNRACPERIILCPSATPGRPLLPYDPDSDDEPAKMSVRKDVLGLGKALKRTQRRRGSIYE